MIHPPPGNRFRRRSLYLLAGFVGVATAGAIWYGLVRGFDSGPRSETLRPDPPPPDPRITFLTPYRNVRPQVQYVGDAACAGCHAEINRSYRAHPMGQSADWIGRDGATDVHLTGKNNPFVSGTFALSVERLGERIVHRTTAVNVPDGIPPYSVPVDLEIGSGRHGRSYLTLDRGSVWQSPISWFRQGERWDVSPGFELGAASRRPVIAGCLYCHVDRVTPIPDSLNRYREPLIPFQASIGCERCHGPGELHVAERVAVKKVVGLDDSIVNPARLATDLKSDVCRQCHLQGQSRVMRRGREWFDFRPGLPWDQFVTTLVQNPDLTDFRRSVGQFEQMEQSRCFAGTGGQLSCTSCHNPHAVPEPGEVAGYFRGRCLTCHATHGCKLPAPERRAKDDSCIACHMPARDSSNISHAAVTDHRIMRRPDAGSPRATALSSGQLPMVFYPAGPHAPSAEERDRDLAVALGQEFGRDSRSRLAPLELGRTTQSKLEAALARWPGDSICWTALSNTHSARGETALALAAARNAVSITPDSEIALIQLAASAAAAGDHELCVRTSDQLIELNPSSAEHRVGRATALIALRQWEKAETELRTALAINPHLPNARLMLGVCRARRGAPDEGRMELDRALRLTSTSQSRAAMSDLYRQLTR